MEKTTVVIPNYNGIKFLENCLASLRKGTVVPHIIVVDNGSVDGSRELAQQCEDVELIAFAENTGFCKAVNAGIRKAGTEYVLLLNNDTVVDQRMVEELEKVLESNGTAFSVAAKMINLQDQEKLDDAGDFYTALGWAFARGKDKPVTAYDRPGRVFSSCAGAALYRRAVFEQIGYFDENHFAYLEDLDLGYRANIFGWKNLYEPKARVLHAGSGVSGSRHNEFKVALSSRNSIYLIYKNMPLLQILLNLPFLFLGYLVKILFFIRKGFGTTYLKGLCKGFALAVSKEGRANRVKFSVNNWKHYCWIQGQLWLGIFELYF